MPHPQNLPFLTSPPKSQQVLGPHLPGLCDSMLSTALFDREVNVRRAAAAALQVRSRKFFKR